ncbi:MAG TPA: tetratricopeptide repeat protein [Myxococcales bacterium]|nr:tetratricopeptide repeat protein [Myxococcales bacterium]
MKAWMALALVALVAFVYGPVAGHGFVAYDDPKYVYENAMVQKGLGLAGAAWAFTSFHGSNWHPLTWLSHMLDVQIFGMSPGAHHLVNAALHALDAVLLFAVLARLTGSRWRSALVAALFAAHPLHVESVAWIAERKDVLSAALFLCTLLAYEREVRTCDRRWRIVTALAFAAGLLAKPMLVTVPVVLVVLDFWPLSRLRTPSELWLRIREKLPLFALSAASCAVTIVAQDRGGALIGAGDLPLVARLANAVVAAALYLWRTVWPSHLAVFYPHRGLSLPGWQVAVAAAALAALTAIAVRQRRDRPFLLAGFAWYLVTLMPVIGIVQVGMQAMADRYTYIPLIGIFVAFAWSLPRARPAWIAAGSSMLVLAGAVVARAQVAVWRNSTTLFQHAIDAVPGNWLAYKNLGVEQFQADDTAAAAASFATALRLRPEDPDLWADVGTCQMLLGRFEESAASLRQALRMKPADAEIWMNLGIAEAMLARSQDVDHVLARLRELDPRRAQLLESKLPEIEARRP